MGPTARVGRQFFHDHAARLGLEVADTPIRGLTPNFPFATAQAVKDFYENTSQFDLDAWSKWHGAFNPFGHALAVLFSRRLQQLNVPLSPLDTAAGITSEVVHFRQPHSTELALVAWIRELPGTRNVLYAGAYSLTQVPGHPSPCVKVVFPLPNGNAMIIMKATTSANGLAHARYVKSMQETIHVYAAEPGIVRANHLLHLWGLPILRLHYRMRRPIARTGE